MSLPMAMLASDQPFPDCLQRVRKSDKHLSEFFRMGEVPLVGMECELIEVCSSPRQFFPSQLIDLRDRSRDGFAKQATASIS
ncbi:hypothetical protein CLV74_101372 [Donghicola tyrosinivorans]|uniref:Uncharacterized protein n=1 Tax=Donghicola tyrosinivorans TaxID=1652492 RepID=A0A2T0X5N0_9RHOB|nr:hypothetical protein CLV74_101372 [Donghicola tyrosinivorans]